MELHAILTFITQSRTPNKGAAANSRPVLRFVVLDTRKLFLRFIGRFRGCRWAWVVRRLRAPQIYAIHIRSIKHTKPRFNQRSTCWLASYSAFSEMFWGCWASMGTDWPGADLGSDWSRGTRLRVRPTKREGIFSPKNCSSGRQVTSSARRCSGYSNLTISSSVWTARYAALSSSSIESFGPKITFIPYYIINYKKTENNYENFALFNFYANCYRNTSSCYKYYT